MNLKVQKDYQNLKGKLNNMSDKIADWLILQKAITTDERELYAYAVHCLFSLLYPIVFASVIGAFFGNDNRSDSYDYAFYTDKKVFRWISCG